LQETTGRKLIPRNVLVLTISRAIWSMSDTNIDNFISSYMLTLGASVPTIGVVNALGSFVAMLLYPIGGYIADKRGRVRLVAYSTLLYTSSFLLFLFASSWELAAFAMIYQQAVLFYVPAMNAVMADSIPVGERGKLYAFNFALPNIIRIVAPYIAGLFIARFEMVPAMRIGFAVSLVVGLFVTGMRLRFLRETLGAVQEVDWAPLSLLRGAYSDTMVSLRWIWGNIRVYAAMSVLLSFLSSMILPFWIIYATVEIGLAPYQWGVILLWGGVARAVLSIFIGEIVDRFGERRCFLAGFLISAPLMYLFTMASGFWDTLFIYSVTTLGGVLMWIASQVYLADSIPKPMRGRIMAGVGSGITLGVAGIGFPSGFLIFLPKTLGNLIGGVVYNVSPVLPWVIQSMFLVVGFVYAWLMLRNPERPQE
jgi:MFS family permease